MQDYGIIQDSKLVVSSEPKEGYKPVEYASILDTFDQTTQYVVQTTPVDNGDTISVGIEIKELPPQDEQPDVF